MGNYDYLDEPFQEADELGGGAPVPDGNYQCKIDAVEIRTNQAGDREYLNWTMEILNGDYTGRTLYHTNGIPGEDEELAKINQKLGFIKHDLKTCGVDIEAKGFRLGNFLTNHLSSLCDRVVEVTAKSKADATGQMRQNTYINELVSDITEDPGEEAAEPATAGVGKDPFEGE